MVAGIVPHRRYRRRFAPCGFFLTHMRRKEYLMWEIELLPEFAEWWQGLPPDALFAEHLHRIGRQGDGSVERKEP